MEKMTYDRLIEVLNYDKKTGIFTWCSDKCGNRNARSGCVAGKKYGDNEYVTMRIDCVNYSAHVLAWFYVYKKYPKNEIDHIDRFKHHNWISNLRDVTRRENSLNVDLRKSNKSGITGVYKSGEKYFARIGVYGINYSLGYSTSFDVAVKMRWDGERHFGFTKFHTTSPAYRYLKKRNLLWVDVCDWTLLNGDIDNIVWDDMREEWDVSIETNFGVDYIESFDNLRDAAFAQYHAEIENNIFDENTSGSYLYLKELIRLDTAKLNISHTIKLKSQKESTMSQRAIVKSKQPKYKMIKLPNITHYENTGKWGVKIKLKTSKKMIGAFDTLKDAVLAQYYAEIDHDVFIKDESQSYKFLVINGIIDEC